MNRDQAKKIAPFVAAFGEGKRVAIKGREVTNCFYPPDDPSILSLLPEPEDPYKPFKDAIAQGKVIQTRSYLRDDKYSDWSDSDNRLCWNMRPDCYRIKPEPKLRPWRPEEVPVGAQLRLKSNPTYRWLIVGVTTLGNVDSGHATDTPDNVLIENEHSLDHGKTWLPCGVLE